MSIFGTSDEETRGIPSAVPHRPESVAAINQASFASEVLPSLSGLPSERIR